MKDAFDFELRNAGGVIGRGREKDGTFPPWHDCFFALFSEFPWAKVSQFGMGKAEGHQEKLM